MSNSIDKTNIEVNNSISDLIFRWMAEFNTGIIFQFENNIEHKFKEVQDRINELEFFHLYHKEKDLRFIVDLKKGFIKFNDISEPNEVEKKENIRLIYFRRHKMEIGTQNLIEKKHEIIYFLGYQYLDSHNINRKIIIQIDENGNWAISE